MANDNGAKQRAATDGEGMGGKRPGERSMELSPEELSFEQQVAEGVRKAKVERAVQAKLLQGDDAQGVAGGEFNADNPYGLKPGEMPMYEMGIGMKLPDGQLAIGAVGAVADHYNVIKATQGESVAHAMFPDYGGQSSRAEAPTA